MKNQIPTNSNSIQSRIGEINGELITLNRKIQSVETYQNKLDNNIREEAILRQNIEKKTFYINETLNNKILSMKKGFDDLAEVVTYQIESLRSKFMEDFHLNNQNFLKKFEESLKRLETYEKSNERTYHDLSHFKSENNQRLIYLEETFLREIKDLKKEVTNNTIKLEMFEKKINENSFNVKITSGDLVKELSDIKQEIEILKNFKENTFINFKDISNELIKNEDNYQKFVNEIISHIQEIEGKIMFYEQNAKTQNENFLNVKKDIYTQIYDNNININNKFDLINQSIYEKMNNYDKTQNTFQNSIIDENEKFMGFVSEQIKQYNLNVKKLIENINDDLELLKTKVI